MQHSTTPDLTNIAHATSMLRNAGARDVDVFELKLRQNAPNPAQVINHLSEARVALMFLEHGALVTMRDSPDLEIEWFGARFFAEVKHFNWKEQDEIDEAAMRKAPYELVIAGDLCESEGRHSYQQISDVARRKKGQYIDGAINILVIHSSSSGYFDLVEATTRAAANEFDDEVRKTPHDWALRKLHGIMLIASWGSIGWNSRNVGFAMTSYGHPNPQMSWNLMNGFRNIRQG